MSNLMNSLPRLGALVMAAMLGLAIALPSAQAQEVSAEHLTGRTQCIEGFAGLRTI